MKSYLLIVLVLLCKIGFTQNTNVYDFAPSAKVTTNGSPAAGGATARSFNSGTHLTTGQYLVLDCGVRVPVHMITFGTFWSSDFRFIPKGYTIDYSEDGVAYSNAVTVTDNQNLSPTHNVNLWGRYWKLTITSLQDGQTGCTISGLQLLANGVGAATNNSFWNGGGWSSTSIHYTAGNVGIGTTTPSHKLTVNGDIQLSGNITLNSGYELVGSSGEANSWGGFPGIACTSGSNGQFRFHGVGSPIMDVYTDGNFYATNDNLEVLHAGNYNSYALPLGGGFVSGNVGIGTTDTKGYKLAVNGDAIFTKVKVKPFGSWPDYVFYPTYKLKPLSEVEKFIQQHKHLSDVPSAKEIEDMGLDVGENQAVLLKKIEELTLYVIEQNKKLEVQSMQIIELQANNTIWKEQALSMEELKKEFEAIKQTLIKVNKVE